ncbi:MAG: glycoside hydrolase family 32 protein, partial [Planctomycetota bacterium]
MREITCEKRYLLFPVKNDADKRRVAVEIDGRTAREFEIELARGEADADFWVFLDVTASEGKAAVLKADADAPGLAAVEQGDEIRGAENLYREKLRPQFHFSSRRGWNNDPNGMVHYDGEWHLYYQHNPYGWKWGNMHWGHAVSPDLVHWNELPEALYPLQYGDWRFSGSAAVDWQNTGGWQTGEDKVIVSAHTSTGRGEVICYSNDRGRTFEEYDGNPILRHEHDGRDPKIIWHEPTNRWVMAVYDIGKDKEKDKWIAFYTAPDLKTWECKSRIHGFHECPELFELPVDGDEKNTSWVVYGGDAEYIVGQFDGETFTPEHQGKHRVHWGKYYASQTFSDAPDGRRIQIGWGHIDMPGMPWNQMMTFPTELALRTTPEGVRMFARFVKEIELLHGAKHEFAGEVVKEGAPLDTGVAAELLDIRAAFEVGAASFGLELAGAKVTYDATEQKLTCDEIAAPLAPVDGKVRLHVLVDRSSVEVCANDGRACITSPRDADAAARPVAAFSNGGETRLA